MPLADVLLAFVEARPRGKPWKGDSGWWLWEGRRGEPFSYAYVSPTGQKFYDEPAALAALEAQASSRETPEKSLEQKEAEDALARAIEEWGDQDVNLSSKGSPEHEHKLGHILAVRLSTSDIDSAISVRKDRGACPQYLTENLDIETVRQWPLPDALRQWVDADGDMSELDEEDATEMRDFLNHWCFGLPSHTVHTERGVKRAGRIAYNKPNQRPDMERALQLSAHLLQCFS